MLQVFWTAGKPLAAGEARQYLAQREEVSYSAVANFARTLLGKGYLQERMKEPRMPRYSGRAGSHARRLACTSPCGIRRMRGYLSRG